MKIVAVTRQISNITLETRNAGHCGLFTLSVLAYFKGDENNADLQAFVAKLCKSVVLQRVAKGVIRIRRHYLMLIS